MPKTLAAPAGAPTSTRELREIARQLTRIADALEALQPKETT